MRKFVEGDKLTLEDVRAALKEAEMSGGKYLVKRGNITPTISNGHLVFDSIEEAEQYYGGKIKTLEEAFMDI